jgi:hypothetical protein
MARRHERRCAVGSSTRTMIESAAWVDYDVDPILVPIEITIEETEP